ncbi:MAG: hypothetical protein L0H84_15675 [Pseudonocardia sp.]|nr:hypothetical protein [Pseudonocardia sp.]
MGHRANLVLVERGSATVRYDHWAACNLSDHLVIGLDHVLRWVRQQEFVGDHPNGGWLDVVWASGGLTADLDQNRLVWFDLPAHDPGRRQVILAILARAWPGWTVEYAARGLGDVAEAAGVPRSRVGDLGPDVRPAATMDATAVDPSGMSEAVTEFLDEFTRTHAVETVHPAIQAMEALETCLGLPAGMLNPAIADHHPLVATPDEVAAVVAHARELLLSYRESEPLPADRPDIRATPEET